MADGSPAASPITTAPSDDPERPLLLFCPEQGGWMCRQSQGRGSTAGDFLTLIDEDGGGEMRSARYHRFILGDRRLKFLCFATPDHPDDYRRGLHEG